MIPLARQPMTPNSTGGESMAGKCTGGTSVPANLRSNAALATAFRARGRRCHARGFTLIELLLAMVAGLIVASAVVSLSKTATTTFQDESRATSTEMAVRTAAERLRADLARASFMSSPNVRVDTNIARPLGATSNQVDPSNLYPNGLGALAGVRYVANGSYDADSKVKGLSDANLLQPDSIILGGNFTTADEYIVQSLLDSGTEGCSGVTARLSQDSSAVLRLTTDITGNPKPVAEANQALLDAFQPANGTFMVRIVDESGKQQFLSMCGSKAPSFDVGTGVAIIPLDTAKTPMLTSLATGARGGTTGFSVGRLTLNPVQLVQWSIMRRPSAVLDPDDNPGTAYNEADGRFELVRSWLDISGTSVGTEVVAEYAVDLKFAFSVDDAAAGVSRQTVFPFGNASNTDWAQQTTSGMSIATQKRPDLVRSVRFKLAARAAIPDRTAPLAGPAAGYIYRYCINPGGCTSGNQEFARVRTVVSEVSLQNQWRSP